MLSAYHIDFIVALAHDSRLVALSVLAFGISWPWFLESRHSVKGITRTHMLWHPGRCEKGAKCVRGDIFVNADYWRGTDIRCA